jgi:type IV pilus assembly protein PilA
MLKKFKKQINNEKGLTLIELLAVIVILAIIAAIAVPAIGNIIVNSKYNAVKAEAINVLSAAQLYYIDNPEAVTGVTVTKLKDDNYLESIGKIPAAATIAKANPHALSVATFEYATGKTVTFTNATITGINANTEKGSLTGNRTINN